MCVKIESFVPWCDYGGAYKILTRSDYWVGECDFISRLEFGVFRESVS